MESQVIETRKPSYRDKFSAVCLILLRCWYFLFIKYNCKYKWFPLLSGQLPGKEYGSIYGPCHFGSGGYGATLTYGAGTWYILL